MSTAVTVAENGVPAVTGPVGSPEITSEAAAFAYTVVVGGGPVRARFSQFRPGYVPTAVPQVYVPAVAGAVAWNETTTDSSGHTGVGTPRPAGASACR